MTAVRALVAIDESTHSDLAIETAVSLSWPPGSVIAVLTVLPTDVELYGGPFTDVGYVQPDDLRERLVVERRLCVDAAARRLHRPGIEVETHLIEGRAATVIVREAERMHADLVIVGARGLGTVDRLLLGSVSGAVVDHAPCTVLVARDPSAHRVLLGVDGSPEADGAAAFVAESGLFAHAAINVLQAVELEASWWLGAVSPADAGMAVEALEAAERVGTERATTNVATTAQRLREAGHRVTTTVRTGRAADALVHEAADWHADLLVVGTRGHGLPARWLLGSTARSVLHRAGCSVLITRGLAAKRSEALVVQPAHELVPTSA